MLLLWSGGVDSTWMLFQALKNTSRGEAVRTISINYEQVPGMTQCRTARRRVCRLLKKSGWVFPSIEVDVSAQSGGPIYYGLIQPIMWLFHVLLYADTHEIVRIGYVKGDDALLHVDKLQQITQDSSNILGKDITLEFPLMYTSKHELIKKIKKEDEWILENVWYCEPPPNHETIRKPCGKCSSCISHKTALWKIEQGF